MVIKYSEVLFLRVWCFNSCCSMALLICVLPLLAYLGQDTLVKQIFNLKSFYSWLNKGLNGWRTCRMSFQLNHKRSVEHLFQVLKVSSFSIIMTVKCLTLWSKRHKTDAKYADKYIKGKVTCTQKPGSSLLVAAALVSWWCWLQLPHIFGCFCPVHTVGVINMSKLI